MTMGDGIHDDADDYIISLSKISIYVYYNMCRQYLSRATQNVAISLRMHNI